MNDEKCKQKRIYTCLTVCAVVFNVNNLILFISNNCSISLLLLSQFANASLPAPSNMFLTFIKMWDGILCNPKKFNLNCSPSLCTAAQILNRTRASLDQNKFQIQFQALWSTHCNKCNFSISMHSIWSGDPSKLEETSRMCTYCLREFWVQLRPVSEPHGILPKYVFIIV